MGPGEIGAWTVSLLGGAVTTWKVIWPALRDIKGKGSDPSLREISQTGAAYAELAANNSTLMLQGLTAVTREQGSQRGQLEEIKAHADKVPQLVDEVRLAREEAQAAHAMAIRAHERIDKGDGPRARRVG